MWLWAKYVRDVNPAQHCTNALRGWHSNVLSSTQNPALASQPLLRLDERPAADWLAIYICGVSRPGYSARPRTNYPHNLHAVILPKPGARESWAFEDWRLDVTNGVFDRIPALDDVPNQYRELPDEFVTCRIFRWAVCNLEASQR